MPDSVLSAGGKIAPKIVSSYIEEIEEVGIRILKYNCIVCGKGKTKLGRMKWKK